MMKCNYFQNQYQSGFERELSIAINHIWSDPRKYEFTSVMLQMDKSVMRVETAVD